MVLEALKCGGPACFKTPKASVPGCLDASHWVTTLGTALPKTVTHAASRLCSLLTPKPPDRKTPSGEHTLPPQRGGPRAPGSPSSGRTCLDTGAPVEGAQESRGVTEAEGYGSAQRSEVLGENRAWGSSLHCELSTGVGGRLSFIHSHWHRPVVADWSLWSGCACPLPGTGLSGHHCRKPCPPRREHRRVPSQARPGCGAARGLPWARTEVGGWVQKLHTTGKCGVCTRVQYMYTHTNTRVYMCTTSPAPPGGSVQTGCFAHALLWWALCLGQVTWPPPVKRMPRGNAGSRGHGRRCRKAECVSVSHGTQGRKHSNDGNVLLGFLRPMLTRDWSPWPPCTASPALAPAPSFPPAVPTAGSRPHVSSPQRDRKQRQVQGRVCVGPTVPAMPG